MQTIFSTNMDALGFFEAAPTLAVALSGGADSMALLLLADDWAQSQGGKAIALTVDHALRSESKKEAEQLHAWCTSKNIEHHILTWQHAGITSAIQDSARDARYELMTSWCTDNHVLHLLTGHHQSDQTETLLFRLARGSGLMGLSAMSPQHLQHGVRHLRPLLSFSKSDLEAFLRAQNETWLRDPSNENTDFTRVHIRKLIEASDDQNAIKLSGSNVAASVGNFRNHMENKLASKLTSAVTIFPAGYGSIHLDEFFALPNELSLQSLSAAIQTLSASAHPIRSEKLLRLHAAICDENFSGHTISGLIIEPDAKNNSILLYRETNSLQGELVVPASTKTLWDGRFIIEQSSQTPLTVRALGSDGLAQIATLCPKLLKNMPYKRILRTFPSLWRLEECICAPHMGYMHPAYTTQDLRISARFQPAKPLAGAPFFVMNSNKNLRAPHPLMENKNRA